MFGLYCCIFLWLIVIGCVLCLIYHFALEPSHPRFPCILPNFRANKRLTHRVGRLLERAKDSGRSDDKIEVIRKRFKTHVESCLPIIERFQTQGTVLHTIDSAKSVQQVYDSVAKLF